MTTTHPLPEPRRFDAGGALLALDERAAARTYLPSRTRPAAYLPGGETDPARPVGYVRDGRVAIVRIEGPLDQRASVDWFGYWDGYDAICARTCAALGDPQVDVVFLVVDSPGGLCAGNLEAAKVLRMAIDLSGKKVVAYADEMICSAAYALACVADEIWTPASGIVGSIGTMVVVKSYAGALEQEGIQVVALTSGKRKADGHPLLPLTADALARFQAEVDTLAGQFVGFVAEQREMSAAAVRALEADTFLGQAAVDRGIADRVGSYLEALAHAHSLITTSAGPSPAPTSGVAMKSVLAHLGLSAEASEADVLAALTARTAPLSDLCAITGKTSPVEAVGVVRGWSQKATAYDTLHAEREAEKVAARAAAVEQVFAMALDTGKRSAAQIEAARASMKAGVLSLDTDEKIAAYKAEIEASPVVLPGKDEKKQEPGSASVSKPWGEMKPTERAALRRSNPEAARALQAAHEAQAKAPQG